MRKSEKNEEIIILLREVSAVKIHTIGVYGYTEDEFYNKLIDNKISVFVDIRGRRGMRGSKYAFVNSSYLQKKLNDLSIRYMYVKALSPTNELREKLKEADRKKGLTIKTRNQLDAVFVERYLTECLAHFDFGSFIGQFSGHDNIVLFCVEERPEACHRSLVVNKLEKFPNVEVEHIIG